MSVRLEPDRVPSRLVLGAIVGTTLGTLFCIALSSGLLGLYDRGARRGVSSPRPGTPDSVLHGLISVERPGARANASARAEVDSWRWVDARRRTVGLPVDRAIDLFLEDEARREREAPRDGGRP
jgi:hypothetical protein